MKEIFLYTDGSCLKNPGCGGYCAILRYKENEKVISGHEENTTNNRMELKAVIEGLKALKEPCIIHLYSDSKYVLDAIGGWIFGWIKKNFKDVKNVDLWKEYLEISKQHKIKTNWVKGHNGHIENERCDTIAREEATNIQSKKT
jgi:ribonuclease HI